MVGICYNSSMKNVEPASNSKQLLSGAQHSRPVNTHQPCMQILTMGHENYEIDLVGTVDKEKFIKVNFILPIDANEELVEFLKRNTFLFAQRLEDMPGINVDIITHKLIVNHMKKLFQQWKRRFTRGKNSIINNKVNSIKKVGWVKEVDYPTWLSNVVLANMVEVTIACTWISLMLILLPLKIVFLYQTFINWQTPQLDSK